MVILLLARYIDPLTGFPYATKEAFNIIRKRYTFSANVMGKFLAWMDMCNPINFMPAQKGRIISLINYSTW